MTTMPPAGSDEPSTTPQPGSAPVRFDAPTRAQITDALRKRHRRISPRERLEIDGELGHGHTLVELRLSTPDDHFRLAIDLAVECEPNDLDNPIVARDVALDYLDVVLADFLANDRRLNLLPEWDAHEVDGVVVKIRGEVTNPALESEADRLLREAGFAADGTAEGDPAGEP